MLFVFSTGLFICLLSWWYLAILALANKKEIQTQFPEYAGKIYRTTTQVITRQGGPVRVFALVILWPPEHAAPTVGVMRVLAGIELVSGIVALASWPFI